MTGIDPKRLKQIGDYWLDSKLLSGCPFWIDAGTRNGEFILEALNRWGGKAVCLDPCIKTIWATKHKIVVLPQVLYFRSGEVPMYRWKDHGSINSLYPLPPIDGTPPYDDWFVVDAVSLAELVETEGTVDLLRMNIEGTEWPIMMHTEDSMFQNIRQIAMQVHSRYSCDATPARMRERLDELGYASEIVKMIGRRKQPEPDLEGWASLVPSLTTITAIRKELL